MIEARPNVFNELCNLEEKNKMLKQQLQQKENIIKEVREYIETKLWNYFDERNIYLKVRDGFLEILEKGE